MFRRAAFLPTRPQDRTFHEEALEEGRLWEARVAKSLSALVFGEVFPGFIAAIAAAAPDVPLGEAREAALTLLYRDPSRVKGVLVSPRKQGDLLASSGFASPFRQCKTVKQHYCDR